MNKLLGQPRRFWDTSDKGGSGGSANAGDKGTGTGDDKSGAGSSLTQEQVNRIVSDRLAEATAPLKAEISRHRDAAALAQAELDKVKVRDAEANKEYEKAKELRESNFKLELEKATKRAEEAEGLHRTTTIRQAITAAAAKGKAINPDQVVALLAGTVKLDDTGTPLFPGGVSIADGVQKFLAENLHMVEPSGRNGGSGATNNSNGSGSKGVSIEGKTGAEIRAMDPADVIASIRNKSNNPFVREGK